MSVGALISIGKRAGAGRTGRSFLVCCALLLSGAAQKANASFYSFSTSLLTAPAMFGNWTLIDLGGLPGSSGAGNAISPSPGTIVLTGINDGSFVPGLTELTIPSAGAGLLQFDYTFHTLDDPHYEYAGYIVGNSRTQLADTDGQSGSISLLISSGETIGFFAGGDDQGGIPGILTISQLSAPVPEPGNFQLLVIAGAVAVFGFVPRRGAFRRRLKLLAAIAGVACLATPSFAQQVYYTGVNVTGALALSGVVNAGQQAQSHAAGERILSPNLLASDGRALIFERLAGKLKVPPPRLRPPLAAASDAADLQALAATPAALPLSIVTATGSTGFNGLSHRDQKLANNGNQFSIEPPSASVAAGNGFVLEGVNNAIQVYDQSGTPKLATVLASNQLFGVTPAINYATNVYGVYPTDMHVYFDPAMNRWLVMQWAQDNDVFGNALPSSHLYLAVSQTGDPTGAYNVYVMNTTDAGRPACPCAPDYPQFGADQYGLHISWNEYNTYTYNFVNTAILTISKASLTAGSTAPTAFQFVIPYVTGYEFSLRPATTAPGAANSVGTGGLEFFASALSSFAQGNQIAVWAMYDTSSLSTANPSLTLTQVLVPTISYTTPPVAAQRSGSTPYGSSLIPPAPLEYLDGGETRVQTLSYAAGFLYLTLATGLNDANGAWVVGGAYAVLSPTYRNGVLAARVMNQGYVYVNGNHLLRPALAVNAQGAGGIAVTLVGNDWYPSAAFIPFSKLSTPTTVEVAATGAFPEDGFSGYPTGGGYGVARWGDYNSATASADGSIWMAMEYIGNYPRTAYANWNTYVVHTQP